MDVLLVWEGEQVDLYHIPNAPDWVLVPHEGQNLEAAVLAYNELQ